MEKREFTCICCPMGCDLKVEIDNDIKVSGNNCKRGEIFAKEEVTSPKRMLTTTIVCKTKTKTILLPVISSSSIEKTKLIDAIKIVQKKIIKAPIKAGDIIIENILNTGVNILSEKTIKEEK